MDSKYSPEDTFSFTKPSLLVTSSDLYKDKEPLLSQLTREKILEISLEKAFYQSKEISIMHNPQRPEEQEPSVIELKLIYEDLKEHLLKIEQEGKVPFHLKGSIKEVCGFFEHIETKILEYFEEVDTPGEELPVFLVPNLYLFMSFLNNSNVTGKKGEGLLNTAALVEFTQLDTESMGSYILSEEFKEFMERIKSFVYNESAKSQALISSPLVLEREQELEEVYTNLKQALLGKEGKDSPLYSFLKLLERSVDPEKESLEFLVSPRLNSRSFYPTKEIYRTPAYTNGLASIGEYIGTFLYMSEDSDGDTLKGSLTYLTLSPYKRALEGLLIYKKVLRDYREELDAFPGRALEEIKVKKPYSKNARREILSPLLRSLQDLRKAYEAHERGNAETLIAAPPF